MGGRWAAFLYRSILLVTDNLIIKAAQLTRIKEIGGGLNFKRKKFLKIMRQIRLGEVKILVVAHKDRLSRFAFDFIEEFASWYGCEIIVANQESLSPQQEMVEDLMAIIHCFSCRLYGLRSYKKKIKEIASISLDDQK